MSSTIARRRFRADSPRVGDQRRERILDSLENLLKATPIAELTMEMIASAASLSRSSVYFYFAGKPDAVDALIARASEQKRDRMYNRTTEESLRAHLRTDKVAELLLRESAVQANRDYPVVHRFMCGGIGGRFRHRVHPIAVSPCLGEFVPWSDAVQEMIVDTQCDQFGGRSTRFGQVCP